MAKQLDLPIGTANGTKLNDVEKRLWEAADELRANSKLKASEYSVPVLGLIFLRFADARFAQAEAALIGQGTERRPVSKIDYQARGVMYLPPASRFARLLNLPEGAELGKEINAAMKAIEQDNEELRDVLPKTYNRLENATVVELLRIMGSIPMDIEGDAFGKIYEYFLGKFAMKEGQKGGEFFTPTCLVKLIVEIIEPFHGRILDPACGSGGMFVQSARFVQEHQKSPVAEISICGQERVAETVRLCKMNLAVHGLSGDIRQGNTYYEDLHSSVGRFDFVMANPPFNVNKVDKEKIKDDRKRYPLGMPSTDNANYLWIQAFYSALNGQGRAGFVMANSAADARHSEQAIRQKLIEAGAVDVVVAIGPNFFYTVTLPCTLWFLDRGKVGTAREDKVLFLDARGTYSQVDRAHREFTPEQIECLANVVRLYRGEKPEATHSSAEWMAQRFTEGKYADVPGLCKVATRQEIADQGGSLNPGRYVGVAERNSDEDDFEHRLRELSGELKLLVAEARGLEKRVDETLSSLLGESRR